MSAANSNRQTNPEISLDPQNAKPLGKYGRIRKDYLKKTKPALYNEMLLSDTLMPYLHQTDKEAWAMEELLMKQLLQKNPYPQGATDWDKTQHKLSLQHSAEETVLTELIQGS